MQLNIAKRIKKRIEHYRFKINKIEYFKSKGVKIGEGTIIYSADMYMFSTEPWLVTIGKNCHITNGCRFMTHDGGTLVIDYHEYDEDGEERFVICGDITIGDNVYIGENTIVLPGVTIGSNTIIGAGSIVTKDIPSDVVAVGVPCKAIKTREDYINKIKDIQAGKNKRYYQTLESIHYLNPNRKRKK